jgi:PDZ domain-containing secreted protein
VAADGRKIATSFRPLQSLVSTHPGDDRSASAFYVPASGSTTGSRRSRTARTQVAADRLRAVEVVNAKLPFPVHFDLGRDVGGPSAGLAFALEILEQKGRDVDHGMRIAATGEIQLDGKSRASAA